MNTLPLPSQARRGAGSGAEPVRYLSLPQAFDLELLRADLDLALAAHWHSHYNNQVHVGQWKGIALRSASGRSDDLHAHGHTSFGDTEALRSCSYFRATIDSFDCDKQSVRLLSLAPGATIGAHRDPGGSIEDGLARLHIPIVTDPAVLFTLDGEDVHFSAGATWYMNANCMHAVRNGAATARVHLVLDCVPNPWLRALFERSGWAPKPPPKYGDPNISDANVGRIIAELRASGRPADNALADTLEQSSR